MGCQLPNLPWNRWCAPEPVRQPRRAWVTATKQGSTGTTDVHFKAYMTYLEKIPFNSGKNAIHSWFLRALCYYCDMALSQEFQPMGALPLAAILATVSDRCSIYRAQCLPFPPPCHPLMYIYSLSLPCLTQPLSTHNHQARLLDHLIHSAAHWLALIAQFSHTENYLCEKMNQTTEKPMDFLPTSLKHGSLNDCNTRWVLCD